MEDISKPNEHRLIAERRRKLQDLREDGQAFPNDFRRDSISEELHATYGGRSLESLEAEPITVSVAGRLMVKRVMGKASFAKLQDRSGRIQLFIEQDAIVAKIYQMTLEFTNLFLISSLVMFLIFFLVIFLPYKDSNLKISK